MGITYEYQSDFARRYFAEGRRIGIAEARAEAFAEGYAQGRIEGEMRVLLIVLDKRGIEVPEPARERFIACYDTHQLERWVRKVLTVNTAEELFD